MSILDFSYVLGQFFRPNLVHVTALDRQVVAQIQNRAEELRKLSRKTLGEILSKD